MANESSEQPAKPAAQAQPPAAEAPASVVKMSPTSWADRARTTFDVSPHAVAGALYGVGPDEQLTEDEVRAKLDEFSVREAL